MGNTFRGFGAWILIILILILAWRAFGQPGNPNKPYGSTKAEQLLKGEYDKDGDHIEVNMRKLATPVGTPTPLAASRCAIRCTGDGFKYAVGGGFKPLTGANSCECPGTADNTTCVGVEASCPEIDGVCVGEATLCGNGGTAMGFGAVAGDNGVSIGHAVTGDEACIVIGSGAECTGQGNIVLGFVNGLVSTVNLFLGNRQSSSPEFTSIQPAQGLGTDIAGADLEIRGGRSTGSGAGGDITFTTSHAGSSGASLNSLTDRFVISHNGYFAPIVDDTNDIGTETEQVRIVYAHAVGGLLAPAEEVNTLDVRSTTGFRWGESIAIGDLNVDTAQCTAPSAITINSGPKVTAINCADNAAGVIYGVWQAPSNWGGLFRLALSAVNENAAPSGTLAFDVSCQAHNDASQVNSTWGTADDLDLGFSNQYLNEIAIASPNCSGSSTGAATVYWRAVVDATTTTTQVADTNIVGARIISSRGQSLFE